MRGPIVMGVDYAKGGDETAVAIFARRGGVLVLLSVVLLGCPPPSPVNPSPDATDGASPPSPVPLDGASLTSDCSGACTFLRSLGCPEGFGVDGGDTCEVTCNRAQGPFDMKPSCISHAGTLEAVRACGTVACSGR